MCPAHDPSPDRAAANFDSAGNFCTYSLHSLSPGCICTSSSVPTLTPTRRTPATSYACGPGVKTPLPLERTYRKFRPRGLGAFLLAPLWGSPRPSQGLLAALRTLPSALLTRGCVA